MTNTSRPLRFLCLEDNARDQELLEEMLSTEWEHCEFIRAKTREEFQTALGGVDLDLIISDFTLPSYDGMSALALARQMRPHTPFIFVSGTIGEDRAVESLKSGAIDYLLKGNLRRLPGAVRRALHEAEESQRRRLAEEALFESHERFRQMAENLTQVFWLLDTQTNALIYVSPAYERIWGRKCDLTREKPDQWLAAVHESDLARVTESLAKQQTGAYDEVYRIVRPDGSVRWIRDRAHPIRNEAGVIYRIVGTAEDITERKELEEQLRQAQKMEAFGQLAGGMAHDFNNQLTVIRGNAELVLMDSDHLTADDRDYLQQITYASERAADLTRQLLTLGRKRTIAARPLNLNEAIGNMTKMLALLVGSEVRPSYRLSTDLPLVQADAGMIEHILVNLAVNAKDAMPQGGELVIITERVDVDQARAVLHPEAKEGAFACLTISDTGTGIPPEILPRIFEPFFTTKEVGKGTGLGLAMVYGIVKQHKGWIDVSSRVGVGTTFTIYLPALSRTVSVAALPKPRGGTETVLLAEDDKVWSLITRRALEAAGYRVITAVSGGDALACWGAHAAEIDLLLTDTALADSVSGFDLAEQMTREQPGLKVVFISGHEPTGSELENPARLSRVILKKPYAIGSLLETVRLRLDGN